MEPIRNYSSGMTISEYWDVFIIAQQAIKEKKIDITKINPENNEFYESDFDLIEFFEAMKIDNWDDRKTWTSSVILDDYIKSGKSQF
jgi:hypothetical protein